MVMIDGITRLLPGTLGHPQSAQQDSFVEGLLDCPHYTRPERFGQQQVPEVLLQGNHQLIRRWRLKQALGRTAERRPEMIQALSLDEEQQQLLQEFRQEQGTP
jgi:tRNA (guanine37-N1)-methyltransferase